MFSIFSRKRKIKNGDKVKITWLPPCKNSKGSPNPYIGMKGIVEDLNPDKSFVLNTGTSILIVGKRYKVKYID